MKRIRIATLSVCAILAGGAANAGEPILLTQSQMDQVTAGVIDENLARDLEKAIKEQLEVGRIVEGQVIGAILGAAGLATLPASLVAELILFLAHPGTVYAPGPETPIGPTNTIPVTTPDPTSPPSTPTQFRFYQLGGQPPAR